MSERKILILSLIILVIFTAVIAHNNPEHDIQSTTESPVILNLAHDEEEAGSEDYYMTIYYENTSNEWLFVSHQISASSNADKLSVIDSNGSEYLTHSGSMHEVSPSEKVSQSYIIRHYDSASNDNSPLSVTVKILTRQSNGKLKTELINNHLFHNGKVLELHCDIDNFNLAHISRTDVSR